MTEEVLFHAALALSPADRPAYLAEHCPDPELRHRVEGLLAAHGRADGVLDQSSPTGGYESSAPPATDASGSQIGPYKLLLRIGEGGMGTVYMAEQTSPVRRMVAVKLIKPGMDSRQVLARFEAERQALALMDHPNIAKVLDAGLASPVASAPGAPGRPASGYLDATGLAGKPYFVMDLVKGIPITKYCDQQHLTPRERLELFVPVCHAVQHAHQKGIIHRDLKPSNVLIALYDGRPVPKVIDFGVAKATGGKLTDRTMFTEFGAVVGTLEYMSPEQAELNQLDIDTRSDIYSLGVLLYELLTGSTPFDRKRLKSAAFDELLRIIREEEPPKPSTRRSGSEELPSIAANRRTEPKRLNKLVRGELDWVVMKCLEKDRGRRYETANGLAADVQRYLANEMVFAGPPSAGYRVRKFVRRNRTAVITAAAIFVAGVLSGAFQTWNLIQTKRAKQEAIIARDAARAAEAAGAEQRSVAQANERKAVAAAEVGKTAKEAAQAREAETKAVLDFVENNFIIAAGRKDQRDRPFRQAVEAVMPSLGTSFRDQPAVEAQLRFTLGWSYFFGDDFEKAAEQFRSARELYARRRGPDHPDTLMSSGALAICYDALGQESDALRLREEALARIQATPGPVSPAMAEAVSGLTEYEGNRRPFDMKLQEDALSHFSDRLGRDHPTTLKYMDGVAFNYELIDRRADALTLYEEVLARRRAVLGSDAPDTLVSQGKVAESLAKLDRGAEAVPVIDDYVRRASGRVVNPDLISRLLGLRLRYFSHIKDVAGCRQTAELWEKLRRREPDSLYTAACLRAVTAAVASQARCTLATPPAEADADRAMAWLRKAISAGFRDIPHLLQDGDLAALRNRVDYAELLWDLADGK